MLFLDTPSTIYKAIIFIGDKSLGVSGRLQRNPYFRNFVGQTSRSAKLELS